MHEPPHLLIVDDERSTRETLEAFLSPEGYEIFLAVNGAEALARLPDINPDTILLDVMMPDMDGYEVCRSIKANKSWSHIPIILVTALDSKQDMLRGLEAGADEFLSKPVNRLELRARVRTMLRIKKQYDDLAAALQLKDDLVNMAVHDMRTPLTTIMGFSQLLLERNDVGPKSHADLEHILRQAQRLQGFTQDMLMLAKIEQGRLSLSRSELDVNDLILKIMQDHQVMADPRGITLVTQIPPGPAPSILLDAPLFQRVVENLLSNALKFSPLKSTIMVQVEYPNAGAGSAQTPAVRLKVLDQGPGIPAEDRERIFNKFEIVGLKQKGVSQIGLGLAFCKLVIEAHGGDIFVEANQPQGSVFTVEV